MKKWYDLCRKIRIHRSWARLGRWRLSLRQSSRPWPGEKRCSWRRPGPSASLLDRPLFL